MLTKLMRLAGILFALILGAFNVQAAAWRGIVPLKSTRSDVERLLGKPRDHGRYQFENERGYIHYAGSGPCNSANTCLCAVSADTVISVYVEIEVGFKFSGLKLDPKKYRKVISSQNGTVATYSNDTEGIIYTVDDKADDLTAIEYLPAAADCQEVLRGKKRGGKKMRSQPRIRNSQRRFIIRFDRADQVVKLIPSHEPSDRL